MGHSLLETSRNIAIWPKRRAAALLSLQTNLGEHPSAIDVSHDWNAVPLAAYLSAPPLSFYLEPAFTEYYRYLTSRYRNDQSLFTSDLTTCGQDVWKAIALTEALAFEIDSVRLDQLDPFDQVGHYLNPWYLRLVEQAFDSLLTLPAYRLQTDSGKGISHTPRAIHDAIQKHGWRDAGMFYDPIIRNGIGHNVEFVQEQLGSSFAARYTDAKGNSSELHLLEIVNLVEGLLDECLAYCFALRLFLFESRQAPEMSLLAAPLTECVAGRQLSFKRYASSVVLSPSSVHLERVNGMNQIRVESLDTSTDDTERLAESLAMVALASDWFPEGETFFLGLRNKRCPVSCLRVPGDALRGWVSGRLSDEELLTRLDPLLLWPLRTWFGRFRANIRRVLANSRAESKHRQITSRGRDATFQCHGVCGWIDDISTGLVKRYRVDVVITAASHDEIRKMLPNVVDVIRKTHAVRNLQSRKRWGRQGPAYITGFLFTRQKRSRDCYVNRQSQFYIGRFEWRDPQTDDDLLPLPMTGDDIEKLQFSDIFYEPNPDWPPADIHVPR